MSNVEKYYDQNAQLEWDRLERLHRAEYENSLRAILESLPAIPARLIDIGGGPGRYAITLAQKGYHVTLVDLSLANLEIAKKKAAEVGVELDGYIHANALDLQSFAAGSFDGALLMGPLYHLHKEEERRRALMQARWLLRPGGILFATFITRFAAFRDAAVHGASFITDDPEYSEKIFQTGIHDNGIGFADAYFARPEEVIPLAEQVGFTTVKLMGCEGILADHEEYVNSLTGEAKQVWLEFNYRFCQEPSLWGASDHLMYIGRKEA